MFMAETEGFARYFSGSAVLAETSVRWERDLNPRALSSPTLSRRGRLAKLRHPTNTLRIGFFGPLSIWQFQRLVLFLVWTSQYATSPTPSTSMAKIR
jgi:hypothetical protein